MNNPEVTAPRHGDSWFQTQTAHAGMWLAMLGFLLCILTHLPATAQTNAKNVLVLFSFANRGDYTALNILKERLRTAEPWPLNFYVEYLDGRRFDDEEYEENLAATLAHKYSTSKPDLVLISSYTGLQFAVRHRDALFPGVPIIFLDIDPDQISGQKLGPAITGITARVGIRETIDLALHLRTNTNTVAVIISNLTPDAYFLDRIHAELLLHRDKVREIDLVGLRTDQLMVRVAALPPQTAVLFELAPQESFQPAIGTNDLLAWIGARFPTYSIFPGDVLGHGGVGGVGYDWDPELLKVGDEARRLLSGERPGNVPIANYDSLHAQLDWRELQRWHIPESALPAGSVILYRPPSLWERDRKYIIIALAVIAAQMLLIIGLLWQRARKRKAETVLRESEERFRVMADTTPSLIWMCDAHGKITYLNELRIAFTGPDPHARYGEIWIANVHPDDVKNVLDKLYKALEEQQPFSQEYRLRRSDGMYRWMLEVASPRFNGDGSFAGFIGSAIDATDQKLAQTALEKVSGQLIEAQEKERSRIARDLHDDICQRLALLSMELEQANRDSMSSASHESLEGIRRHCSEISTHVHLLSHQLHSSKLDYLGVVAAIRGMCKESAAQHEISIVFSDKDVPKRLPKDIALCLFRVAQEAVHNAVKYSGTREFSVEIVGIENEIQLVVQDAGAGFDVEETKKNPGLGMISMQERMNLVHGKLSVESTPGEGTRIIAIVPLNVQSGDDEAASFTRVA